MAEKILIIRFSSFGDIVQSMACVPGLALNAEIHYLTKNNFAALPSLSPNIKHVYAFDRKLGLWGLIKLAWKLRQKKFSLVYDAHQNPRSKIVRFIISFLSNTRVVVRKKDRFRRFLFFYLKKRDAIPMPFKGMVSFCKPVKVVPQKQFWDFTKQIKASRLQELNQYADQIVLVPSAAWKMKRWPADHWKELVQMLNRPSVLLGGPEDIFCQDIAAMSASCTNLAGKLSLVESCYLISKAKAVISADTGLLHVADLLSIPVIALLGPTAFGHPTFKQSKVVGVELECRPCTKDGRGKCSQAVWQKCMVDITPKMVITKLHQLVG